MELFYFVRYFHGTLHDEQRSRIVLCFVTTFSHCFLHNLSSKTSGQKCCYHCDDSSCSWYRMLVVHLYFSLSSSCHVARCSKRVRLMVKSQCQTVVLLL